ncbi:LPXTG cell wall anchor domain-containing protein [Arthrobacter sp. HLT1-20]
MKGIASCNAAKVSHARGGSRLARAVAAIALAGGLALATGAGALAASGTGPSGQTLTVDRATGLAAAGDSVQVSGAGFDLSKGIYLGVCVNNGPGAVATPCLGGVDTTGGSGSSIWISSNPPAYGQGLAQPFAQSGGKGSFSVSLAVSAADALTNCEDPAKAPNGCVIVTRADHTRSADRTADVAIPISFGAAEQVPAAGDAKADAKGALAKTGATTGYLVAGGAVLLSLGAGAVVLTKRRRGAK